MGDLLIDEKWNFVKSNFAGHKKDTWIAIDVATGAKMQTLSSDGTQKMCPSSAEKVIYIGRTEYTINMFDSKTGTKR